jgi:hypothetical protein
MPISNLIAAFVSIALMTVSLACSEEPRLDNKCSVNADCVRSQAAKDIENLRCGGGPDLYCLNGECHGECRTICEPVRTDVNPCPDLRLCALPVGALSGDALSHCTITPIECETTRECPLYLPPLSDGGTSEWSCEDGVCRYPELEYTTR